MRGQYALSISAAGVLGVLVSVGVAHATCAIAADNCLVGTWQQTGGGAAEWMREYMKMAQVTVTATKAIFTFKSDGTFSTSKVDAKAEVTSKQGEPMQAIGHMSSRASGQWSAAGGKLTLCNTALDSKGSMQLKLPGGKMMNMPMPQAAKPSEATMDYTCAGDTLSTVQAMPMNSTITTTYTRVP